MTIGPSVTFVPVPGSWTGRVACSVCGRTGLPSYTADFNPWQRTHLRGHRPCDYCGEMLVVLLDGGVRCHGRCPA